MGYRVITIRPENCTGCRLCELACSSNKEGHFMPGRARIKVVHDALEGWSHPAVCLQCEEPMCLDVCPVGAINKSTTKNGDHVVLVDKSLCIGCRRCVVACPFGAMEFYKGSLATKCDLCGGDPMCVQFCFYGCLQFVDLSEEKRHARNKKIKGLYFKACKQISAEGPHRRRATISLDASRVVGAIE